MHWAGLMELQWTCSGWLLFNASLRFAVGAYAGWVKLRLSLWAHWCQCWNDELVGLSTMLATWSVQCKNYPCVPTVECVALIRCFSPRLSWKIEFGMDWQLMHEMRRASNCFWITTACACALLLVHATFFGTASNMQNGKLWRRGRGLIGLVDLKASTCTMCTLVYAFFFI
jgi:hypothetical protein